MQRIQWCLFVVVLACLSGCSERGVEMGLKGPSWAMTCDLAVENGTHPTRKSCCDALKEQCDSECTDGSGCSCNTEYLSCTKDRPAHAGDQPATGEQVEAPEHP